jgi:hypothetical protein
MKAQQLLDDLALTMGLQALPLNEDCCARLVFDSKIAVDFESDPLSGELFLKCEIGALPLSGREALFRRLLEANLYGQQTLRATLALDSSQQAVVLWRAVFAEELSLTAFTKIVEDFVNCAEGWMGAIEQGGGESDAPIGGLPGLGAGGMSGPGAGGYLAV